MVMGFVHNLSPYVSCIGQAACRAFEKGNAMGSGTAKFKDAAVIEVLYGCVVAQENSPYALA